MTFVLYRFICLLAARIILQETEKDRQKLCGSFLTDFRGRFFARVFREPV